MSEHPDTSQWSEFDWERYLRDSDEYAARFFSLLKRFCDLPGSQDLISKRISREFRGQMLECEFNCESCKSRYDCEFSQAELPEEEEDYPEDGEADEHPAEANRPLQPGDDIYYEAEPVFINLRQTAIGWCNVYAAILPTDARPRGLRVLFHLGRALATLAYSIGDGTYQQPAASIALAKRSLAQVNTALGQVAQLIQEKPHLRRILETMKNHIMKCRDNLVDYLHHCRGRLSQPPRPPATGTRDDED